MNQKQNRWGTLLLVLGMCLVSFSAYAVPEGEFATWTGVRVDWQLNPKVKFRGTFQARTQNGLKDMERERLNVGLNYRVLPLLQLKGYYELQYRDRGSAGWKIGHRYQAGFIVSGTKRNIKLGWRELWQHTFIGGTNEAQLRSRLRIAYESGNWVVYPYIFHSSGMRLAWEFRFCLNLRKLFSRWVTRLSSPCHASVIVRECDGLFPVKRHWTYIIAANMT